MRVLLLSEVPEDKVFVGSAAELAQMPFEHMDTAEEAVDGLKADPASIIFVDATDATRFQTFEKLMSDKIGLFSAMMNPNSIYFISSEPLHELPHLAQSEIFGHFVERTYTTENIPLLSRLFLASAADRPQTIEHLLDKGAKTQTLKINKALQKRPLVESVKEYILKIGFKSRVAAVITTAVDELIMNAIFDAPVDQLGKHIHAQTSRDSALELDAKNVIQLKIAFDGKTLAISVIDPHGSLNKRKLLSQHLSRSYETKEYETKTVVAGAGLGLARVYRNCGGMVIFCEQGTQTEVGLLFKKTDSFKDFKDQFRFLSTFMYFV